MKYAAAYIRVSDDRQDEYSPDSQLKLIREYAGRNGYCVLMNMYSMTMVSPGEALKSARRSMI